MAEEIKWPDFPEWEQQVKLSGTTYRIRARYNTTAERWVIDLLTQDKEEIITGVRVVRGVLLLAQYTDDRLPSGDLMVIGEEPNRSNMGTSSFLVYEDAEL